MVPGDRVTEAKNAGRRRICIALVAFAVLSLVGSVIAVELTDVYVRARVDPDYQSFCAVSEGMNCHTVALSDYSTVAGVPVSVWATSGYFFALLLSLLCLARMKEGFGRGFLLLLSVVFSIASVALLYIMSMLIESQCILCLAVDAINFGMLAMALLAAKAFGQSFVEVVGYDFRSFLKRPLLPVLVVLVGIGSLAGARAYGIQIADLDEAEMTFQQFTEEEPEDNGLDSTGHWTGKVEGECGEECPCEKHAPEAPIQMGMDRDGHPWIGHEKASLVIQEFTDYECPHCGKAHLMVRKLLSNYPGKVKVYHRHYPLDVCNPGVGRAFHPRACELSKIAVCAARQGRFWEMNEFLFQHAREIRKQKPTATEIAKRLELNEEEFECCMADDNEMAVILEDTAEGAKLNLKGTPAFVVDGKVYYGRIPDEAVESLSR